MHNLQLAQVIDPAETREEREAGSQATMCAACRSEQWVRDAYGGDAAGLARPSYSEWRLISEEPSSVRQCALEQIALDLPRTFLGERLAYDATSRREALSHVLVAHALSKPQTGYVQGMHAIAGIALLPEHTEANPPNRHDEERAFLLLHFVQRDLLPGFFDPGLTGLMAEQALLGRLVDWRRPEVGERLTQLGTSIAMLPAIAAWFLTCFMHEGILHAHQQARAMDAFTRHELTPLQLALGIILRAVPDVVAAQDVCGVVDALQREAHSVRAVEAGVRTTLPPTPTVATWRSEELARLDRNAGSAGSSRGAGRRTPDAARRLAASPTAMPTSRPEWVADGDAACCGVCELPFTMLRRRHHCRLCGHIFCDACCAQRRVLPASLGYGDVAQRVCLPCTAKHAL